MNKLIYLLLFIPVFSYCQYDYQWIKIENISFYDLSKNNPNCDLRSVDQISKGIRFINCNISSWNAVLSNLSANKNDLLSESCYVLFITFKNGVEIPFQFFPRQKVIVDLRKGNVNSFAFKKEDYKKVDNIFKSCIDCLNDPKCKDSK
jgi:hypothetical protein